MEPLNPTEVNLVNQIITDMKLKLNTYDKLSIPEEALLDRMIAEYKELKK